MTVTINTGIVYTATDVSRILGMPCECNDPAPEPGNGEVVIYYGGWDLQTLRSSPAGKGRMWQDLNWYDQKGWKAGPGYYRVLLRVPDSNRRNWNEQVAHLRTIDNAPEHVPVTVAATALLVHLTEIGNDLLRSDWCRCAEPLPGLRHVVLVVYEGRVHVDYYWDGYRYDYLWLSAIQKSRALLH